MNDSRLQLRDGKRTEELHRIVEEFYRLLTQGHPRMSRVLLPNIANTLRT